MAMLSGRFASLPLHAFSRLRQLLEPHAPGGAVVDMAVGEPRHPFPSWVAQIVNDTAEGFNRYPSNDGTPGLLRAIADWVALRYGVALDPAHNILALNGTREGLYNAAMALCPETKADGAPAILFPNPFYQVYMVAALSVGAQPILVPATRETGFLPDYAALSPQVLKRTAIAYVCSPANPQGVVADETYWKELLALAERYDFTIFADECYSEIYRDTPPVGALQVARQIGADPERVVIFHSLSKRSNLPGLRSGFAAGGARTIAAMKQLRAYAGAPLPLPLQAAAQAVWGDEAHVVSNRAHYRQKFDGADALLRQVPGYFSPPAGFFLWLAVPPALGDGAQAALHLWRHTGVRVLPGAYLSRTIEGENPGQGFIRVALVETEDTVHRALVLLRDCLYGEG